LSEADHGYHSSHSDDNPKYGQRRPHGFRLSIGKARRIVMNNTGIGRLYVERGVPGPKPGGNGFAPGGICIQSHYDGIAFPDIPFADFCEYRVDDARLNRQGMGSPR
jgi:hypothetical protein